MADIAAPAAPGATATAQDAPDPRRWVALAVVLAGAFMVLLDVSIVNVAIPSIQRSLNASFGQVQLVLAGYQLSYAVVLITGGRLGDIYGRKRLFMTGMAGFVIASALCGLAQSPEMLIISRVVQGLMAALMFPQVLSVVQVVFPPRERPAAFGLFGAVIGIATIAGPLVGGLIIGSEASGERWRWIFLVNLPVGIAALIAAAVLLGESRAPRAHRLDVVGVVIVSAALGLLTYPLVEGRDQGWPAWSIVMLVVSLPAFIGFVLYERAIARRHGSPLVELGMFTDRAFRSGTLLSAIFFSSIPSFFFTYSLTVQIGLGFSALRTGLTTVPWSVATAFSSAMSVRFAARLGKRILGIGAVLLALGIAGIILTMHQRGLALNGVELVPAMVVAGLGLGCIIAPLTNIILAGISKGDAGSASGVLTTMQQVGGAMGVAIVGVIFFGLVSGRAGDSSATAVAQLRADLAAQQLPAADIDNGVQRFQICFHDRAAENDPTLIPPSCGRLQVAGDPGVTRAFQQAGRAALGTDFVGALERALLYQIGVYIASFLLVFVLPSPARREGMQPAAAH